MQDARTFGPKLAVFILCEMQSLHKLGNKTLGNIKQKLNK